MVLGLLAQNCFPLVLLLERAREEVRKGMDGAERREDGAHGIRIKAETPLKNGYKLLLVEDIVPHK